MLAMLNMTWKTWPCTKIIAWSKKKSPENEGGGSTINEAIKLNLATNVLINYYSLTHLYLPRLAVCLRQQFSFCFLADQQVGFNQLMNDAAASSSTLSCCFIDKVTSYIIRHWSVHSLHVLHQCLKLSVPSSLS